MKKLNVIKFGGSSLGSPVRIKRIAEIVEAHRNADQTLIVVVSAMGKTTNELLSLAEEVTPNTRDPQYTRELDMLLTAGERISMSLLSMALRDRGFDAISFTGSQSGIITSHEHGRAQIVEIKPIRLEECLNAERTCIVAGFQGVNANKDVTTLGRGGSDTTACALGSHFNAECVYIYTDVDGVYSENPVGNPEAKLLPELSYDKALEMAENGAKVLHPDCVRWAQKTQTPIRVLSSFSEDLKGFAQRGTLICKA